MVPPPPCEAGGCDAGGCDAGGWVAGGWVAGGCVAGGAVAGFGVAPPPEHAAAKTSVAANAPRYLSFMSYVSSSGVSSSCGPRHAIRIAPG
jgi:hypothetical protein